MYTPPVSEEEMINVNMPFDLPKSKYPVVEHVFVDPSLHDLAKVNCLLDVLVELLQEKYGCDRQAAEAAVDQFLAEIGVSLNRDSTS